MASYNFRQIEKKWQEVWEKKKTFKAVEDPAFPPEKRMYCLEMFPYPSGSGLHVGHLKNYVPMDAFCRYQSMKGMNVLHPMGWDAFGQPAENEAIKRNRNPRDMVPEYAANYRKTLKLIGCSYDWDREINSSLPEYYKWTQWIFLLLYKKGLAYKANAFINWCPKCKTGLANEEVKDGRCWRCDTPVEKKPMLQWWFKITAYADRLLKDLDNLDWSVGMKEMQRDWIGRSEGAEVDFAIDKMGIKITVFTTRPDTLFGATFLVLAPEHEKVEGLITSEHRKEVEDYLKRTKNLTEMDRMNDKRTKTGAFTGSYAVNPVNGAKIPVWIADYVLLGYGTGAIMCVPGHDARDFEFAKKFGLPIVQVVSKDGSTYDLKNAEPEEGIAVNSGPYNGLKTAEFKKAVTDKLEQEGKGHGTVNFKMRDWLISRQRYWGAPIPIIHCPDCGEVPVPEKDLPVMLPEVENYQPTGTGESPLAGIPGFVNVKCPKCGKPAKRETDTMGGYACSSWYFLRFADPKNNNAFASKQSLSYWLPVDLYAGGIEHARSHLLYSRFWVKVLYDEKLVDFQEPFLSLKNQGSLLSYTPGRKPEGVEQNDSEGDTERVLDWIVLKPEERSSYPKEKTVWRWARMSKSKGNVITPEEMAEKYGADTLRAYMMFVAPFEVDVQWTEEGIQGSFRFLNRIWRWLNAGLTVYKKTHQTPVGLSGQESVFRRKLHQAIAKISKDLDAFQFNTAVASLMELCNEMYSTIQAGDDGFQTSERVNADLVSETLEIVVHLLSPFAPHLAEEIWENMGSKGSIVKSTWPLADPAVAAENELTIPIQINGKLRDKLTVPVSADDTRLKELALSAPKVAEFIKGKEIIKVIVIPGKLVNIVVK